MRPEDELLLCCARTRLDAQKVERVRALLREEIDYVYLVTSAIRYRVGELLYWHLHNTFAESLTESWTAFLADHSQKTARRNLYLAGELFKLLELFRANGILAIPYKGPVLSALAYGNLALRPFVDLDLFIRQQDVPEAHEFLTAQGYRLGFDLPAVPLSSDSRVPGQYLFHRGRDNSIVELHTELTSRFFPVPLDLEQLTQRLQTVSLGSREVRTFSVEDSLWILCVHGAMHFWDRLLWICDIAELAQHPRGVSWEMVEERARQSGCERMLFLGLCLAHDVLGAFLPEEVVRRVQASPAVRSLVASVRGRLFQESNYLPSVARRLFFRLRMRESLWEGAQYCLRLATSPTEEDWSHLRLPRLLAPLYAVLRPLRLIQKHGLGLVRRAKPDLAPFVPTPPEVVERMLALGEVGPNDVLYDLGCGDGRIVVAAAKRFGIRGVGVDIDARHIAEAEASARREGVQHLVSFMRRDAKTVDVSRATVVTLSLTWVGNIKLRWMLQAQLHPGARVVSRDFEMGDWLPERTEAVEGLGGVRTTLFLWRIRQSASQGSRREDAQRIRQ